MLSPALLHLEFQPNTAAAERPCANPRAAEGLFVEQFFKIDLVCLQLFRDLQVVASRMFTCRELRLSRGNDQDAVQANYPTTEEHEY